MLKILPITFLFAFLVLSTIASAYNLTYIGRDFVESPNANTTAPSIYWENQCETKMILYASATNAGPYVLTHSYYSPDTILIATATKNRNNPITCEIQNAEALTTTAHLNNFFEGTTKTEYTSSGIDTWLNLTYECEPNANDYFIYSNTRKVDSYGNHPFAYGAKMADCFAQSPSSCPNTLTSDIDTIKSYLYDGYYSACGNDIRQDAEGEAKGGNSLGISSDLTMNYWTMIPFNSMGSGIVNISIWQTVFYISGAGNCGASFGTSHQYYLWDTVTNTTENLGTAFPFSVDKTLVPNRDYWLFIGSRYYCLDYNFGTIALVHNYTNYNVSIFAYDPEWICGDWSDCVGGFESRQCYDQNGRVPDKVEERACFVTPTVDIDLGFEEFYEQDIWICQKDYWLVTCTERLESIPAKYPVNWTVIGSPISGKNLENFLTVSQDWASKGSSSLKLWYYPPKNEEPVAPTPVCGNATSGRFAEIASDYNETLFIARNVSFESPYIQMRFDVKKCALPVVQYDYGTWFACGKKCYANNCSVEPEGRYGIRITDNFISGNGFNPTFAFYDEAMNDETVNVTDGNINTYSEFTSVGGALINSSTRIFENGTFINFTLNVTGGSLNLCLYDNNSIELTRFSIASADTLYSFNYTIGNLSQPIHEINLLQCIPPSRNVRMRLFDIIVFEMITTTNIIFDYYDHATIEKQNKILDFSNVGLQTNHNYTISIAVNPENVFDSNSHCIYLDDFSITFTDVELPACESYCDGLTYYSAYFVETGVCAFTISPVSSDCITDPNVQKAIDDNTNFEFEDEFYVWNNETREWEIVDVPPPSEQEAQQLSLYEPPEFAQEILLGFGLTQATYGYIWFFFSLFMLINYIALGLGIAVTVFMIPLTQTNQPQVGSATDKTFIPFMVVVIMILVGATFSGWYPLEIGIPIIVAIGILLWKTMEKVVGGER